MVIGRGRGEVAASDCDLWYSISAMHGKVWCCLVSALLVVQKQILSLCHELENPLNLQKWAQPYNLQNEKGHYRGAYSAGIAMEDEERLFGVREMLSNKYVLEPSSLPLPPSASQDSTKTEKSPFKHLPRELITAIALSLPLICAASFTLSCWSAREALGTQYLQALKKSSKAERSQFFRRLAKILAARAHQV